MTYGFDNIVDQLSSLVDFVFCICHDKAVEVFFLITSVSGIRSSLAFLHGAFPTDGNLSSGFSFHFLQGVSTRSDK